MKKPLHKVIYFLFLSLILTACGGGGGGGDTSSAPVSPGPAPSGTLYADDSVGDINMFARVSGTTITSCVVDSVMHDVYTGTSTIGGDKTFSTSFLLYPTGGATSVSATGVVDASGATIPTTIRSWFILNTTMVLPDNPYAGVYYGSNTIDNGSGTFVAAISAYGNMFSFFGSDTGGWVNHQEFLGLYGNAFSFKVGNITLNGSASATDITGTWQNSVTQKSGTFIVPKICTGVETPSSSYTLAVNAANGTVAKNPNQTSYASGTSVQLTATANSGYTFTGWSGDITGTANPVTVTMNSNKTITANFTSGLPTSGGQYEVWGGNVKLSADDNFNPENHGYVNLGSSNISNTFLGSYNYYVVVVRNNDIAIIDAVGGSNGKYLTSTYSGNTVNMTNVNGPPDGLFASVGAVGTTGGFLGLSAVAEPLTSITVYTQ